MACRGLVSIVLCWDSVEKLIGDCGVRLPKFEVLGSLAGEASVDLGCHPFAHAKIVEAKRRACATSSASMKKPSEASANGGSNQTS